MTAKPETPLRGTKMKSHPIGRVEFDSPRLQEALNTISGFQMNKAYSEYSRGDWTTCVLLNHTGNKEDGLSEEFEGHGVPTEYGLKVPYLLETINRLFKPEYLKSARIFSARNGFIIPHRDYLEFEHGFTRIHLVLSTNDAAMNSEQQAVYRMRQGELWFLEGRATHSGGCFSGETRLHLVMDFAPDIRIQELFREPADYQPDLLPFLIRRPSMSKQEWNSLLSLGSILSELNYDAIFEIVAKLHFEREVDCEATYDCMLEVASQSGNPRLIARAKSAKQYFLGDLQKAS